MDLNFNTAANPQRTHHAGTVRDTARLVRF